MPTLKQMAASKRVGTKVFHPPSIEVDCENGGFIVQGTVPTTPGKYSFNRYDGDKITPVRGSLSGMTAGDSYSIIDYEAPISGVIEYILQHDDNATDHLVVKAPVRDCPQEHYLRSVFNPQFVLTDFCLGEINEVDYKPKAGIHTVLGRRDPVVIIDSQETARGTLRFISQNRAQLNELKRLLTVDVEPMLLSINPDYSLGQDGVLYFMPLEIRDRWVLSDARIPKHVFEVSFVEISRPPMTEEFVKEGIPFDNTGTPKGLKQRHPTFEDLVVSGKNFFEAEYIIV